MERRKYFNRCVHGRKMQYWVKKQTELLNACETSDIFWKTIGKQMISEMKEIKQYPCKSYPEMVKRQRQKMMFF